MTFNYNGADYTYPASLAEITLQQRIELHVKYGVAFEEKAKELVQIEDANERAIEEAELKMLFACQCFSFFTGIDLETILESFEVTQIMNVYNSSLALVLAEEAEIQLQPNYDFANERWVIAPAALMPNSKITFNEFITSKEVVRQLDQFGKGKWQSLLYLCCIYFRKEGEDFKEDMLEEGGERMTLMMSLPMDIALAVGFFLSNSISLYLNTLLSLNEAQAKE